MDKQTIQNIMQFMMRVQLTGQEVPAFNEAMNALQEEFERTESNGSHQETSKEKHS